MREPRLWTEGVDAAFPSPAMETLDWLYGCNGCNACAHPQQVSTLVSTRRDVREMYVSGAKALGLDGVSGPSGWEMGRMGWTNDGCACSRGGGLGIYRGKRGVELVCGASVWDICGAGVGWWKEGCSMQLCKLCKLCEGCAVSADELDSWY